VEARHEWRFDLVESCSLMKVRVDIASIVTQRDIALHAGGDAGSSSDSASAFLPPISAASSSMGKGGGLRIV